MSIREDVDCPTCGAQAGEDCVYSEAEAKGHAHKKVQSKQNHEARQRKWWKTRGIRRNGAIDDLRR